MLVCIHFYVFEETSFNSIFKLFEDYSQFHFHKIGNSFISFTDTPFGFAPKYLFEETMG
jgi:hypothetical protein